MEPIALLYKGTLVVIDLGKKEIRRNPNTIDEIIWREAAAIAISYIQQYDETGKVIPFERAKQIAAYVCIPEVNLLNQGIADIAKQYGVTKEFVRYRIGLQVRNN